jgi:hypothetical protein
MYKITIEIELPSAESSRYPTREAIFEQRVETLDVQAVIAAINNDLLYAKTSKVIP